ncbi:MAG TPA: hypothetical protein PLQ15_07670 [Syntrophales bacterium]|nr:hypothetical protein [Syntrophobacterales bacterium]HQL90465.1 hypothetical protein [Syntrophales bacterium]
MPEGRKTICVSMRRALLAPAVLVPVLPGGCAPPQRVYTEGVLAADYRLMSKPELIRHLDSLENEIARVHAGGTNPGGVPRDVYPGDLRRRMKDVLHEIGLRNIRERKSYRERMEMWGPTR